MKIVKQTNITQFLRDVVVHLRFPVFALLLFGLALLLRLNLLDAQSLWLDEGSTWRTIQQGWDVLLLELLNPTSAYPLYHVLLKGWVALAGDSEWALRLPSAICGAAAVVVIYKIACEAYLQRAGHTAPVQLLPLTVALLLTWSPFAIWYAQEAKAYSLLLFVATLLLWGFLHALRLNTPKSWLIFGSIALTSVFVHRLAVLLLIAAWFAWLWLQSTHQLASHSENQPVFAIPQWRQSWLTYVSRWLPLLLVSSGVVVTMAVGLQGDRAEAGAYIAADPLLAVWLTFLRFTVDRGPAEFQWWWLLPWVILAGWGFLRLSGLGAWLQQQLFKHTAEMVSDMPMQATGVSNTPDSNIAQSDQAAAAAWSRLYAQVVLIFLWIPLIIFLVQLTFTRLYEARYLILIYPAWILLLADPMRGAQHVQKSTHLAELISHRIEQTRHLVMYIAPLRWLLVGLAVVSSIAVLVQPGLGIFSGYPVKEQYREAMQELAQRIHPDDLVVVHPGYLQPLYFYYMHRLSADAAPKPATFADFWHGETSFGVREWDTERRQRFAGYLRSFLLIAPNHARTVDQPVMMDDEYGLVGLYYAYSMEQQKWPCGIWRSNGVHLLCQASPEAYETGIVPKPETRKRVRFGRSINLLGYTLKETIPDRLGVYQAGGGLPITLFFDVRRRIDVNYNIFLHLCHDCSQPPVASDDRPPLGGYLPTSVWLPGKPARDDRLVALPADMPPGRYTLLLGLYRPGDGSPNARLPIRGKYTVLPPNRLVLGEVEIVNPEKEPSALSSQPSAAAQGTR